MTNRAEWNTYRTRFLVRARQLTEPLAFIDGLGREHRGRPGDYLVESGDGSRRITPRAIFEDVYVSMSPERVWDPMKPPGIRQIAAPTRISSGLTT